MGPGVGAGVGAGVGIVVGDGVGSCVVTRVVVGGGNVEGDPGHATWRQFNGIILGT